MISDIEIRGGADEFEAAVIAVVLDRITREEEAARRGVGAGKPALSAWVRAIMSEESRFSWESVHPD